MSFRRDTTIHVLGVVLLGSINARGSHHCAMRRSAPLHATTGPQPSPTIPQHSRNNPYSSPFSIPFIVSPLQFLRAFTTKSLKSSLIYNYSNIAKFHNYNFIMREIIHLQVGQFGNQVGRRFWELLLSEQALILQGHTGSSPDSQLMQIDSYFDESATKVGRSYVPCALAIDLGILIGCVLIILASVLGLTILFRESMVYFYNIYKPNNRSMIEGWGIKLTG
jgi:hypothetical protein